MVDQLNFDLISNHFLGSWVLIFTTSYKDFMNFTYHIRSGSEKKLLRSRHGSWQDGDQGEHVLKRVEQGCQGQDAQ